MESYEQKVRNSRIKLTVLPVVITAVAVVFFWWLIYPTMRTVDCVALSAISLFPVILWMAGYHDHKNFVRRMRRGCGLCIHCGYDVRMSNWRCPECGHCPECENDASCTHFRF